jgi:signal peptidase II
LDFTVTARIGFAVAALVFLADQLIKWAVTGPLGLDRLGEQLTLLPIFDVTYVQNQGISLGLLNAGSTTGRWLLVLMTAAIAIAVAVWIMRERSRTDQIALGLVLGGALGNILDRVRLGYVVDYADLHFRGIPAQLCPSYDNGLCRPFLVFNLGDAAISIGVVILLLHALVSRKDRPEETVEHA